MNELESTEEQEQKVDRKKCFRRGTKLHVILENLKGFKFLGMLLETA